MNDLVKLLDMLPESRRVHYAINFMAQKGCLEEFADWLKTNAQTEEKETYNFDLELDEHHGGL